MRRTFFAFQPDASTRARLARWVKQSWPALPRPVTESNYHITLCFVGQTSNDQLARLVTYADRVLCNPCELILDQTGYFPKPGILWVGPSQAPPALLELASALQKAPRSVGIKQARSKYVPHLTVARGVEHNVATPLTEPCFRVHVDRFSLFESRQTERGLRYFPLETWFA